METDLGQTVRAAVFPVAGRGTRFLPATKASPKEMLPVVDKPLIQYAVEEAIEAGATKLVFVTGSSKRAIEDILKDFEFSHGLKSVVFRYFNVAGADPDAEVGEFHQPETHLIPLMLDAIDGKRCELTVFGTDYDTPDGTCIRDYVHVSDLIDAHMLGLEHLLAGGGDLRVNLGTESGFSVREVIDEARRTIDAPFEQAGFSGGTGLGMGVLEALNLEATALFVSDRPAETGLAPPSIGARIAGPALDDDVVLFHPFVFPAFL